MRKTVPIRRAFFWIALSTILISGGAGLTLKFFHIYKELRVKDKKYQIAAIKNNGLLDTNYLLELLQLSFDKPTNLYLFSKEEAVVKLNQSPLIKEVEIKKNMPATLSIDYSSRLPVAFVVDFTNTAVDVEGVLIPFSPFFSEKKLPKIYLGEEEILPWGSKISGKKASLALKLIQDEFVFVDVSCFDLPSYGQREIVVVDENSIVRLNTQNVQEQLNNYRVFKESVKNSKSLVPAVIDLRVPKLALISPGCDLKEFL